MTGEIIAEEGVFVGRIWRPELGGPSVCTIRDGVVFDITNNDIPTVSDLLEKKNPVDLVSQFDGEPLGDLASICEESLAARGDPGQRHLLAPNDLQAVKACGVTFARSMVERVIEEAAAGDAKKADEIRSRVASIIGKNLKDVRAGSEQAEVAKQALIGEGLWSQYLEVGIGPDAEVFTKCQPMASVGWGAPVGLHPVSDWNNPEPEVVLAVDSCGTIKGATVGNDVNLRDVEGRSALLLGKAKDNNASCAIGPFIRLFDTDFDLDTVRKMTVELRVEGKDGFVMTGHSSMTEISRDPADLVSQTVGEHHQYPDGFMLFLGTMFAPTQDRGKPGNGFTHKLHDLVEISAAEIGCLRNEVLLSTQCRPWTFGTGALMRNLVERKLI